MADPLSLAGTAVGVISLGIQVIQSLSSYYSTVKAQDSEVAYTRQKLASLLGLLESLRVTLQGRKFAHSERDLLTSIESHIQASEECIQELEHESKKLRQFPTGSFRASVKDNGRHFAYPFRRSTLLKLDEDIDDIVARISLALQLLQQKTVDRIQRACEDIKIVLDQMRITQVESEIQSWLKAPDSTINFNDAYRKKQPGTGRWLIESPAFSTWISDPRSLLWLRGFAGCGKSVLCSTAIQHTLQLRKSDLTAVAFFFFTFSDERKQDASSMLRAIVLQLSNQIVGGRDALGELYNTYRHSSPPEPALMSCLRHLVRHFHNVYILLDGLDESPRDTHRGPMLDVLDEIRGWSEPGLHLLVTSRDEQDIADSLEPAPSEIIVMRNREIDKDIANFIAHQLRADRRLRKWQGYHDLIERVLLEKSKGVYVYSSSFDISPPCCHCSFSSRFRWVECQLRSLETCPKSQAFLEEVLQALPVTLDETYRRMLGNIPAMLKRDAQRMLMALCCAARPLTGIEMIDIIATETGENGMIDPKRRLDDIDELRCICPGLTEMETNPGSGETVIRIAHFSVQEYLESDRIRQNADTSSFGIKKESSHKAMASLCLSTLLAPQEPGWSQQSGGELAVPTRRHYAFFFYAVYFWFHHYDQCRQHNDIRDQVVRFFRSSGPFKRWSATVRDWTPMVFNCSPDREIVDRRPMVDMLGPGQDPLCYATALGLIEVFDILCQDRLSMPSSTHTYRTVADVANQKAGAYPLLLLACHAGKEAMVLHLLGKGANINIQSDGGVNTALRIALLDGDEPIVRILMDHQADPNIADIYGDTLLRYALRSGHKNIALYLRERGASEFTDIPSN